MAKILLIDDSTDLQECFTALLNFNHHQIQIAYSTKTLYEVLPKFEPDLVLMDVKLSGENGRDLCEQLKKDPATAAIPVILISANPELLLEFEECGADDILEKPFDIDELYSKIDKHLPLVGKH